MRIGEKRGEDEVFSCSSFVVNLLRGEYVIRMSYMLSFILFLIHAHDWLIG